MVAALRSRHGASNEVLRLVAAGKLVVLATPPLFLEYEEVIKRPEQQLTHGMRMVAIEGFLSELAAVIVPVELHFQWRPQGRDPSDEMVVEAAINSRADALITHNIADFIAAEQQFEIQVLRPAELLKKMRL